MLSAFDNNLSGIIFTSSVATSMKIEQQICVVYLFLKTVRSFFILAEDSLYVRSVEQLS